MVNPFGDGPEFPIFYRAGHFKMNHPVGQCRRHLVNHAFILSPVTRRHLAPPFRQGVFPYTPIQDQLVGSSLDSSWCGSNLIIKDDPLGAVTPYMGWGGG